MKYKKPTLLQKLQAKRRRVKLLQYEEIVTTDELSLYLYWHCLVLNDTGILV